MRRVRDAHAVPAGAHAEGAGRPLIAPPVPAWLLSVWLGSMALVLAACASTTIRVRIALLTRDPGASTSKVHWVGAAALAGIMAWTASAIALLLGGHALRRAGTDPARARLLTEGGMVLTLFAADDAFLVHEYWVPRLTGAPDAATYLVLISAVAVLAFRHRHLIRSFPRIPLVLIGAGFAISLTLDVAFDVLNPFRAAAAVEDVPKLWAVALLAVMCVRAGLVAIDPRVADEGERGTTAPGPRTADVIDLDLAAAGDAPVDAPRAQNQARTRQGGTAPRKRVPLRVSG